METKDHKIQTALQKQELSPGPLGSPCGNNAGGTCMLRFISASFRTLNTLFTSLHFNNNNNNESE
eukprot:gene12609-8645_t